MDERILKEKYCEAMGNVEVCKEHLQAEVEKRLHKHRGNKSYLKMAAACVVLLVLVLGILPTIRNAGVVMNVYAADGSRFVVDKEGVALSGHVLPSMGVYTKDMQNPEWVRGSQVFKFLIGCDHDNVETITYTIQGEHTVEKLKDKGENQVWFAKKLVLSEAEYEQRKSRQNDGKIYSILQNVTTKDYTVMEYIGSSYTVKMENQFDEVYCVEFRTNCEDGVWKAEEFQINVLLEMKDGSTVKKKLLLQPVPDDELAEIPEYEVYVREI